MLHAYRLIVPQQIHVEDEEVGVATKEDDPRLTLIVGNHLDAEINNGFQDVNTELLFAHVPEIERMIRPEVEKKCVVGVRLSGNRDCNAVAPHDPVTAAEDGVL